MRSRTSENLARQTSSGLLTIDLTALVRNYRSIQSRLVAGRAGAVVKADAYGLGASRIAPALYAAGCRDFFTAHVSEAIALRSVLPDDARLFALNGVLPGGEEQCVASGIAPVVSSLDQARNWAAAALRHGRKLPAILQIDTGMSRLGLSVNEATMLSNDAALLDCFQKLFLMSHLASADEPDHPQNGDQLAALRSGALLFPGVELCFANSAGVLLGAQYHGALVRPGIALYGGAPTTGSANPMLPVVQLHVRVLQTHTLQAGARIGYGADYVATGEMRVATIGAGYADGLPRHLSNRGAVYHEGVRLPIVGRVSMDSITVDVTALPAGTLKFGDLVEVIGPHQTLEQVASAAGTISYEILTSLGSRYHREYAGSCDTKREDENIQ